MGARKMETRVRGKGRMRHSSQLHHECKYTGESLHKLYVVGGQTLGKYPCFTNVWRVSHFFTVCTCPLMVVTAPSPILWPQLAWSTKQSLSLAAFTLFDPLWHIWTTRTSFRIKVPLLVLITQFSATRTSIFRDGPLGSCTVPDVSHL